MKRLFVAVPLVCSLIGCNSSSSDNLTERDTIVSAADGSAPPPPVTLSAKGDTPSTGKPAAPKGPAPDSRYKVVDEASAGMPEELVNALEHVKVAPPPAAMKAPDKARVRLLTSKGPITVELNGKAAPLHVKSYLHLTKMGFFDGTVFHRFADLMEGSPEGKPGRIIQGGDPLTKVAKLKDFFGQGGPGYQIPREVNPLKHVKMVLAAARSSDPDSAGSQFYLTLEPVHFLDEGYTVFGKVVEGQANVLKLRQGDQLKKAVILSGKK